MTEAGSEGHISEVAGITENDQNSAGISDPIPSAVEPKGNNYYPMVNFKYDDSNNNTPGKEKKISLQGTVKRKEIKLQFKT